MCASVCTVATELEASLDSAKNILTSKVLYTHRYNCSKLTLNAPIATKVVCFSRLLKCLRSLYGKQCGPRSDCSYRSSLFWVHTVCFYTYLVINVRQLFAADDFSRRHFQMHYFLGALRFKACKIIRSFPIYRYNMVFHALTYIRS